MQDFGLALLGRAIVNVTFSEAGNPYAHAMGVVHAAHAAEIILKARIAEEHPLLIFTKLPKPDLQSKSVLSPARLLAEGRTLSYEELPDALWSATGYRLRKQPEFYAFGKLRNTITHLAVPQDDFLADKTFRFCFQVIAPAIWNFWKADIFDKIGEYDDGAEEYVVKQLKRHKIFLRTR